jgi:hypothetical protein
MYCSICRFKKLIGVTLIGATMKFSLLACAFSMFSATALAQVNNDSTDLNRSGSQPDGTTSNIPPGGCTPIGLTAQGELVFPIQCRELIEHERGPIPDQQVDAPSAKAISAPSQGEAPVTKQNNIVIVEKLPRHHLRNGKPSRLERLKPQQPDPDPTGSIARPQ